MSYVVLAHLPMLLIYCILACKNAVLRMAYPRTYRSPIYRHNV